jgi:[ribosomal protein S5]-alanine N-acetyltransferase
VSEIRTARLLLRRARHDDLEPLHEIFTDARAMRYWSRPAHADLAETRIWLQSTMDSPADASDDYIIEYEGRAIGKAGCWRLPEIGFILHPDFWGRGLAREAVKAAIANIFAKFPIPALIADVDPRNRASLGLLTRLGFVETGRAKGTYQLGEELCDSVYLALPRPT